MWQTPYLQQFGENRKDLFSHFKKHFKKLIIINVFCSFLVGRRGELSTSKSDKGKDLVLSTLRTHRRPSSISDPEAN